ncbi:hypothetical protein HDE_11107 [Halotydeus destructor]|nr:hypothetical protein HDE_11107 [Halotydeus destructor]
MSSSSKTTSKELLRASEQVRTRHALLKEMSKRTKQELEDKVSLGSRTSPDSVDDSERLRKDCWYLDKLLNVLNVQEKLMDNRVGCTFQSSDNYADIMQQLDKLEKLIKEIELKCSSVSV